jgi:hypothetical protein
VNYFIQAIYALYPQVTVTIGTEAFDAEGNQVEYDPVAVQEEADKLNCKAQATTILNATDWTSIPDVGSSTASNPYLVNQAAFIAYRSQIRALAVNPVANPVFPTQPTEQWSS